MIQHYLLHWKRWTPLSQGDSLQACVWRKLTGGAAKSYLEEIRTRAAVCRTSTGCMLYVEICAFVSCSSSVQITLSFLCILKRLCAPKRRGWLLRRRWMQLTEKNMTKAVGGVARCDWHISMHIRLGIGRTIIWGLLLPPVISAISNISYKWYLTPCFRVAIDSEGAVLESCLL